jgi:AcrR family transcriptional regulator
MKALMSSTLARDRLLTAALERFAADGILAVSLDDVRAHAGVSVGAVYHHFADKQALVDALYLELTREFQTQFTAAMRTHPGAEEGIKAGVKLHLRWVSKHRAGAAILLAHRPSGPELGAMNKEFFREITAWWQTHVHYGTLRNLPLAVIHALWLGPAHEYTRAWLAGEVKRPPSAVTETLAQAAWDALKEDA